MKTFVPHESTSMVCTIRRSCEQAAWGLLHHIAVLVNHAVTVRVSNAAEHITQSVLRSP